MSRRLNTTPSPFPPLIRTRQRGFRGPVKGFHCFDVVEHACSERPDSPNHLRIVRGMSDIATAAGPNHRSQRCRTHDTCRPFSLEVQTHVMSYTSKNEASMVLDG
jgi:hypothetical protein